MELRALQFAKLAVEFDANDDGPVFFKIIPPQHLEVVVLHVDAEQVYLSVIQVLIEDVRQGGRRHLYLYEVLVVCFKLGAQLGVDGRIFVVFLILVKDHFFPFIRNDGMEADIPLPDPPELFDQGRIAVGADALPAFHVELRSIGFLDGVVAADVDIKSGSFVLAKDRFQHQVLAAHGMRKRKPLHFELLHQLAYKEM